MLLHIKNMVCHRCRMAVADQLARLHLTPVHISLGEVTLEEKDLDKERLEQLSEALQALGFELIDDRRSLLIEQVKNFVIDAIHYRDEPPTKNYSALLAQHLHHDYSHISRLFSEVEGITIEQYIITQKIEKVKELLLYGQLSLSQMAFQLGYSSTAHLSSQFKKLTGLTPSAFRRLGAHTRIPLDKVGKPE